MGRPKGSVNKKKEENLTETAVNSAIEIKTEVVTNADVRKEEEKREEVLKQAAPKLEPLGPGQAYFEAPDGTIVIGDDTKNEIWYRAGNNGKGMFINRKR